jgi:hypothetical protein
VDSEDARADGDVADVDSQNKEGTISSFLFYELIRSFY